MSNCLLINIKECHINQDITQTIQPQKIFCICCLENNVRLISLNNCDHSNFLNKFSIPDPKQYCQVVCIHCHTMLKKIKEFELQIEESFKVLSAETHTQKPNLRRTNLNIEKKEDIQISDNCERIQNELEDSKDQLDNKNGSYQNTPNSMKLKNLQNALDVISSNNSLPLFELLSGINSLRKDVLGRVVSSDSLSANFGTPPSAGECVNTQKNCDIPSNNVAKTKTHTNPIKKMKLTKKQLMNERYYQSWSKAYLKYPYKCENCIQGFNYKENLEDHMSRKHDAKLGHACDICLQNHPAGTINTHKSRHYIRYLCVECLKTYPSRDEAVFHYQKRHAKKYKCGLCGYLAEDLKRLCNHRVKRHRFSCKECGVVYATSKRLRWHEMLKHKDLTKESV